MDEYYGYPDLEARDEAEAEALARQERDAEDKYEWEQSQSAKAEAEADFIYSSTITKKQISEALDKLSPEEKEEER